MDKPNVSDAPAWVDYAIRRVMTETSQSVSRVDVALGLARVAEQQAREWQRVADEALRRAADACL